ncbi:hypothetical protein K1719_013213 [Acacia pycnantha]|nr:hypothetical protein K1719_013213 [Acacia pycnantha]
MSRFLRFLLFSLFFLLLLLSVSAHSGHHDDDGDAGGGDDDHAGGSEEDHHDLRSRPLILAKIWCLIVIFFATFIAGVSPYVFKWNEGFLVLGTQFAGGVFLGTAMMHFLSDANETFDDLTQIEYPFAFMLACSGYLMTMMADFMISSIFAKQSNNRNGVGTDVELRGAEAGKGSNNGLTSQSQHQVHAHNLANPALTSAKTTGDAWKALWTISLHKIFAAIAMGIALLRMIPNRPLLSCAAYSFAFAISSPIGVAIGIIIDATTQGRVADWIFAISMGLACGVFIYVSINHLLAKGYIPQNPTKVDTPRLKFLAVLLGVGVIAVVMIWDT